MENSKCLKIIKNQILNRIYLYRKRTTSAQGLEFSHIAESKCHILFKYINIFTLGNFQASITRRKKHSDVVYVWTNSL